MVRQQSQSHARSPRPLAAPRKASHGSVRSRQGCPWPRARPPSPCRGRHGHAKHRYNLYRCRATSETINSTRIARHGSKFKTLVELMVNQFSWPCLIGLRFGSPKNTFYLSSPLIHNHIKLPISSAWETSKLLPLLLIGAPQSKPLFHLHMSCIPCYYARSHYQSHALSCWILVRLHHCSRMKYSKLQNWIEYGVRICIHDLVYGMDFNGRCFILSFTFFISMFGLKGWCNDR